VTDLAQVALFGAAVFLAVLTPLLYLNRPGAGDDEPPAEPEPPPGSPEHARRVAWDRTWRAICGDGPRDTHRPPAP
jgi:hypothetical protein